MALTAEFLAVTTVTGSAEDYRMFCFSCFDFQGPVFVTSVQGNAVRERGPRRVTYEACHAATSLPEAC